MRPNGNKSVVGRLDRPTVPLHGQFCVRTRGGWLAVDLLELLDLARGTGNRVQEYNPVDHLGQRRCRQGTFVGRIRPAIGFELS